nr:uncharacterized protein LOC127310588 [Lolium perenne]
MTGKLGSYLESRGLDRCSIDVWQRVARNSRQFLKGWGANLGKEKRLFKEGLLAQVADLDRRADSSGLAEDDWALRYFLEDQLISLDRLDEEYWRQRSRVQWTLKGDSYTAYFHAIANGRRRKCAIPRLITDHGEIEDQTDLMKHVYDFYIGLMGSSGEERVFSLAPNLWGEEKRVSPAENLALELTFTQEELDEVLLSMKTDTAPGPDGLPVSFFKRFWGTLRAPILQLLNDFVLGRVDIARLNFGVISLIPKVPGADSIRQFRPIALINVIFKFVAKAYAIRLAPLAHRIIDRSQTAFIRGRCLHEGVLALHEIAHELRAKKLGGLLLKLDFEKAYDRVNWDFLREVLLRKGFSGMMVHRLMQLVMGGQTAINVNGLPVSDRPLRVADWCFLPEKVGHRVDPWQGLFLASAGRLELTNSCLSSLPMFAMGIYLLHDATHLAMDRPRSRFFWEGVGNKRKYHMVDWATVCKPKEMGGLGILNTKLMNIALMLKWIWKLYQNAEGLWADLIRAKYLGDRDLFDRDVPVRGSQFWNAIHKIKWYFKLGARHKVRNGKRTYFWLDWWSGPGPLRARFPRLFSCCDQPFITVDAARDRGGAPGAWRIRFRRQFSLAETVEWDNLCREIQELPTDDQHDVVSWSLEPSGMFSAKSVYYGLTQGASVSHFRDVWRARVPPKIKVFLWQLIRGKLPSSEQVAKRRAPSNGRCSLCGEVEDCNHIFFTCHMAGFM